MSEHAATVGLEVAERLRFADLQARAADQGYVLRQCRTGFVLRRVDGLLLHRISLESVVAILNAEEGPGP
jgi:hypothetical protein